MFVPRGESECGCELKAGSRQSCHRFAEKLRINTDGVFSVSRTYVFRLRFQGRHPVPMVTVIGQCLRLEWSFGRNAWSYYGNISGKLARVMSKNHSP